MGNKNHTGKQKHAKNSEVTTFELINFPTEILAEIFSYLDTRDMGALWLCHTSVSKILSKNEQLWNDLTLLRYPKEREDKTEKLTWFQFYQKISSQSILVIWTEYTSYKNRLENAEYVKKLLNHKFRSVELRDATTESNVTIDDLKPFAAILVYSQNSFFGGIPRLAAALQLYLERGYGGVVLMGFAICGCSIGSFDKYFPITPTQSTSTSVKWSNDPKNDHNIFRHVAQAATLTAAVHSPGKLKEGSKAIASWSDRTTLCAENPRGNVVTLNFTPLPQQTYKNGFENETVAHSLIQNALLYVAANRQKKKE